MPALTDHPAEDRAIGEILYWTWDPIGVSWHGDARDEYDSYAPGLRALIAGGAGAGEVAAHLERLEREAIELTTSPERRTEVAERLLHRYACPS
ncbi:MAG: hypothetical protein AB7V62_13265 [Thermoleophilia bacterium]